MQKCCIVIIRIRKEADTNITEEALAIIESDDVMINEKQLLYLNRIGIKVL